jgi:hypothetical protein
MEVFIAKGVILALVVVAGTLCIFLGYRLYVLGVVEKGRANVNFPGAKVTLSDYGPGVVFSLFGALLLVYVVQDKFVSDRTVPASAGPAVQPVGTCPPAQANPSPIELNQTPPVNAPTTAPAVQPQHVAHPQPPGARATAPVPAQLQPGETSHYEAYHPPEPPGNDVAPVPEPVPA